MHCSCKLIQIFSDGVSGRKLLVITSWLSKGVYNRGEKVLFHEYAVLLVRCD